MAHLWMQVEAGQWTVKPLDDWFNFLDYDARDLAPRQRDDRSERTVAVVRVEEPMGSLWTANPLWVLTAGSQAKTRVNGGALLDRFRLLQDRDEIRIRTKRFYFAAKSPPMVIKYRGLTRERTKTGRSYARNVSGVSNRSPRPCVAQSVRAGIISQKMNRAGRRVSRARCVRKPQTCTHSLSGALKTERLTALRSSAES
ncbi:MAG: hypothetical protein AABO57_02235 [Acidobacteriota bacterium]